MTDDQLFALLGQERDENGYPKFDPPSSGQARSSRDHFNYHCFLLGITEPAKVEAMWQEQVRKWGGHAN